MDFFTYSRKNTSFNNFSSQNFSVENNYFPHVFLGFGAPASSFARPLTFGKYFNSKKDENNSSLENTNIVSSVSKSSPKPKTNTKKINIDEESSQDFVVIQSPSNNKKRVLTEHQKDLMRKRRDDIPGKHLFLYC